MGMFLSKVRTNKWVRSNYVSAYAYAYVAGVLTSYAYVASEDQPLRSLFNCN